MKKIFILVIILFFLGLFFYFVNLKKEQTVVSNPNTVLFKKEASWGPCFPGSICVQMITLYYSGQIEWSGKVTAKEHLEQATVNAIVDAIKESGIMEKACPASEIMDYGAIYTFSIDNKEVLVKYPGCEADIKKIEKLLPTTPMTNNILSCDEIIKASYKAIDTINFCEQNVDCLVFQDFNPFGCIAAINKNADQSPIKKLQNEFEDQGCTEPRFDCYYPNPMASCVDKKCVINR
jgi:hypothetical protein